MKFRRRKYNLVLTDHARARMAMRGINEGKLVEIIETGMIKAKEAKNKFWVFKEMQGRTSIFNLIELEARVMKISYDKKADALSIVLNEGRISRDVEVSENVFAGFDRSGQILEVQFLEVSKSGPPWLTLEAAAKYLGKSERTLMRWIKAGKICPKKVGREYRIDPKDLEKLAS